MMRVAARALSVFCPHCQKRVTLESLRIVGSHPGKTLATCGDIFVEPASQLNLEITANNVVVRGRVNGAVNANGRLQVASTGRVFGNVRAARIVVEEGGVIQGRCEMTPSFPVKKADETEQQETATPEPEELVPVDTTPRQIRPIHFD